MSWPNLDELPEHSPLRGVVTRALDVLRGLPAGIAIDPLVLAKLAGLDEVQTLAALAVLLRAGAGAFVVQVVNALGQPVGEYSSLEATPRAVSDDYGEEVEVEPHNTHIVFRPSLHASAA